MIIPLPLRCLRKEIEAFGLCVFLTTGLPMLFFGVVVVATTCGEFTMNT